MSKDNSKPKESPCFILITFESHTSIEFKIESEALPTQFKIAGDTLMSMGQRAIDKAWSHREMREAQKRAELAGIQQQIKASKN